MSEDPAPSSVAIPVMRWMLFVGGALVTGCGSVTVSNTTSDGTGAFGGSSPITSTTVVGGAHSGGASSTGGVTNPGGGAAGGGSGTASGGTSVLESSATGAGNTGLGGALGLGGAGPLGGGYPAIAGATGIGGAANTGGLQTVGGTSGTAGATLSTGGASLTGGTASLGGTSGSRTATATGGALTPTGGAASGGGVTTGGLWSTGGVTPIGGAPGTGGMTSVPLPAIAVATGYVHTCAVMSDGTVRCWGNNCHGQLGDGRSFDCASEEDVSETPVKVSGISNATAVSAGASHTCAVLNTGKVQCWGANYHGQLGDGTRNDSAVPVDVVGISTAVRVVIGGAHTCALLAEGTVQCWGPNYVGQLGSGATVSNTYLSLTPVNVVVDNATPPALLDGIQSIASDSISDYMCALQEGGAVYCWGDNEYGQLLGATSTYSNIAIEAKGITARAVDIGHKTTCALLANGAVSCWGQGDSGELGDGLQQNSRTPVNVGLSSPASGITVGSSHGCAILDDANRGLECWGDNLYSQLGDGTGFNDRYSPVSVKNLSHVRQVSATRGHTCAIVDSGALYCWGDDYEGQCGPNSSRNHVNGVGTTPVIVTGF